MLNKRPEVDDINGKKENYCDVLYFHHTFVHLARASEGGKGLAARGLYIPETLNNGKTKSNHGKMVLLGKGLL